MIIVLIGTIIFLLYLDKKITVLVESYIEEEVERMTTNIISSAISKNIVNRKYKTFIEIDKTKDNEIKNIEYNILEINRIKTAITKDVHKRLIALENGEVEDTFLADRIIKGDFNKVRKGVLYDVNIGSIRKTSLFSNVGPVIPIKLVFIGQSKTDLDVLYKNYGINNIIVQINIIVKVKEQIVMPISSKRKTITVKEPISMNIIKGEIPKYFGTNLN